MQSRNCPKCNGEKEIGVIPHKTQGSYFAAMWVAGPVKTSFWTGLVVRGRPRHWVDTYRCTKCGYLESYATVNVK
jgi:predicted RNA-binding Zn-ribbon protein involved in translation (DUF1610 family)